MQFNNGATFHSTTRKNTFELDSFSVVIAIQTQSNAISMNNKKMMHSRMN